MSFYLQVLTTDNIDSSTCIALFTESHRFLFNCGEGIQRLCVEHKVRLSKLRALLFTDFSPHNIFGLPGLALTAADAGNTNIRIGGPPEIKAFLHTTRYFMKLNDGLLNFPNTTNSSSESSAPETECISTVFNSSEVDIRMLAFRVENPSATDPQSQQQSPPQYQQQRNCFVGSTAELQGKFDLQRATALRVPKGPLFGKLKNGQSVTLEDGTVITPNMVLGESELKKYFIVVCSIQPEETQLLHTITSSGELNRFQEGHALSAENGDGLKCMVHLSPAATVYSTVYQNWVRSFGSGVTHIYTGAGCSTSSRTSFLATTVQCNKLHLTAPGLFPSMRSTYAGLYEGQGGGSSEDHNGEGVPAGPNHVIAAPLLKFHFLPVRSKGTEHATPTDCSASGKALYEEALQGENEVEVRGALQEVEEVRRVVQGSGGSVGSGDTTTASIHHTYNTTSPSSLGAAQLLHSGVRGSVSFLGTGCSIPSKYRNVSGILLQVSHNSSSESSGSGSREDNSGDNGTSNHSSGGSVKNGLLIDAGEGTWAQMLRLAYEHACNNDTNSSTTNTDTTTTTTTTNTSTSATTAPPSLSSLQHRLAALLKVVWVSHPHADHHLGLVRVIVERKRALCGGGIIGMGSVCSSGLYGSSDGRNDDSMVCDDTHTTTGDSDNASSTSTSTPLFTPLLVIAPPSILSFLHEYTHLYPYLHNAYTPVSCRAYDPDDSCLYTDCYWNSRLLCGDSGSTSGSVDSGSGGSGDSNSTSGSNEQEVKRQRTHSPVRDTNKESTAATTTTGTESSANGSSTIDTGATKTNSKGSSSGKKVTRGDQYSLDYSKTEMVVDDNTTSIGARNTSNTTTISADIIHTMLHNNDSNSTICNMDPTTTNTAKNTTTATSTTTKVWRNFASVFREALPAEVLKITAAAKDKADAVLRSVGVVGLKNMQVIHCGQSYGLCITIAGGGSDNNSSNISGDSYTNNTITDPCHLTIAYSGDTRPCPSFVAHCAHATLLIHEATFEDDKQQEALTKRHSTMHEAYSVGRAMGAYRTLFTHFSQRYPGVPFMVDYGNSSTGSGSGSGSGSSNSGSDSDGGSNSSSTSTTTDSDMNAILALASANTSPHMPPILAFDYMHVQLTDLLWAPAVTAVMSAAYGREVMVDADE